MAERDSKIVNSGVTKDGARFIVKKDLPDVQKQQSRFDEILKKFKLFSLTSSNDSDKVLSDMNDKISAHTFSYLNKMKDTTGNDITRFLNKTIQSSSSVLSPINGVKSAEDLFNSDSNNFSAFFFERYKNINNKYEDLRIITEYLYELQEAISTIRDDIVNADDLVSMVSREISFGEMDKATGSSGKDSVSNAKSIVEGIEDKYKIKERLKNIILPGVLTYGNFFVYSIPYKDVFAQYEFRKKQMIQNNVIREGVEHPIIEGMVPQKSSRYKKNQNIQTNFDSVTESLTEKYNALIANSVDEFGNKVNKVKKETIAMELKSIFNDIDIVNNDFTPFMEDSSIASLADDEVRNEALKAYRKASTPDKSNKPFWERQSSSDAVIDINSSEIDNKEYKDIPDVFIKLYPPERVIPVYIMDFCVGYYVLYETYGELRNSILLNSSLNRTNLAFATTKRKELDDEIINVISTAICNSIDKKYVAENPKFKELILNAISYQDFYRKKFKVQYIPVNYMHHFKINEDPDTHMGTSVLAKSLFYGKLYLSLLLFKIITILTKSNDMRIYYIRNAGINKNMTDRVQQIARDIKEKQISFNDLASIQTIFSKVGAYKEAFIPMGKSGEKNIEFDILSGQDVQLNTDLMEMLRKGMINNSGVPAIILSFMEEVDYARTITMQHSKYMGRVITYQTELEPVITEWYKSLLTYDSTMDPSLIESFKFNFVRPKALNTQNMNDLISNAEAVADFITKMMVDENDAETTAGFKRRLIRKILLSGVFNWKDMEDLLKNTILEMQEEKKEKELISSENS